MDTRSFDTLRKVAAEANLAWGRGLPRGLVPRWILQLDVGYLAIIMDPPKVRMFLDFAEEHEPGLRQKILEFSTNVVSPDGAIFWAPAPFFHHGRGEIVSLGDWLRRLESALRPAISNAAAIDQDASCLVVEEDDDAAGLVVEESVPRRPPPKAPSAKR